MLRALLRGHPVVRMYNTSVLVLTVVAVVAKVVRARRSAKAAAAGAAVASLDPAKEVRV